MSRWLLHCSWILEHSSRWSHLLFATVSWFSFPLRRTYSPLPVVIHSTANVSTGDFRYIRHSFILLISTVLFSREINITGGRGREGVRILQLVSLMNHIGTGYDNLADLLQLPATVEVLIFTEWSQASPACGERTAASFAYIVWPYHCPWWRKVRDQFKQSH